MKIELKEKIADAIISCYGKFMEEEKCQMPQGVSVEFDIPRNRAHGDLTTNFAMKYASFARKRPIEFSRMICDCVLRLRIEGLKKIEPAGPGFINIFLEHNVFYDVIMDVLRRREKYAVSEKGKGKKVIIEFVSANPTGPLTVAHGRQAAVGDALARLLANSGYEVFREYYLNDRGRQMDVLGKSLYSKYMKLCGREYPFPDDGYKGLYIDGLAQKLYSEKGAVFAGEPEKTLEFMSEYAKTNILEWIKKDLMDFGVEFDSYFSENEFSGTGKVEKAIKLLKEKELIYEKDGAVWFNSRKYGDDKDRVIVKSSGEWTYITPDIAYHKDKLDRGFDVLIDLWGPDHHGYIPRMKAAIQAMGFNDESLKVVIIQLATLYEGKNKLSMSTRQGEFISLREVMDEVGADAARYFFLMLNTDSHLDFDLELAKKKSAENPVYYVQYTHARICSILEKYSEKFGHKYVPEPETGILGELINREEKDLIKKISVFPSVVELSSSLLEPHRIHIYLSELASLFHSYYHKDSKKFRIIGEKEDNLTLARMALVSAVKIVIASGLNLMGITAPEKM
ncbi:MAG: arginine--tRNA ligase [bacterium]|nr:arginine--tRNA ligase [bacterium]